MDGLDDAWAVLGLVPGADRTAVRRAFRDLARTTHPDHGGDARTFQRVRSAFERVLPLAPDVAVSSSQGANPYRGFLAGLDRAARMTVVPLAPTPATPAAPVAAPVAVAARPSASAARFAAVLADALAAA